MQMRATSITFSWTPCTPSSSARCSLCQSRILKMMPTHSQSNSKLTNTIITCAKKSERRGSRRYPSEIKRLGKRKPVEIKDKDKERGFWRFCRVAVPVDKDPGKDHFGVSDALLESLAPFLKFPVPRDLPKDAFSVIRKSFDARKYIKEPKFIYTVDMDVKKALRLQPRLWDFISDLDSIQGKLEYSSFRSAPSDLISLLNNCRDNEMDSRANIPNKSIIENSEISQKECSTVQPKSLMRKPEITVVGSGPAGLFASLVLSELGAKVTIIERGQPVEIRGRDIGALVVRKNLNSESNFCFGEGGAGTWSDGKLTTKIGRNEANVQLILKTLVHFGAPSSILIDGKPHLGTDKLVRILLNFRKHLQELGVQIMFGTKMKKLLVRQAQVVGVQVSNAGLPSIHIQGINSDAVVLAVGHSARDVYEYLVEENVELVQKDFSAGFRIEHPQEFINKIQYSALADQVERGKGKLPVADYRLATFLNEEQNSLSSASKNKDRSCYSFCMCPGGQVVLTSTDSSELCINGMSFSTRSSKWANAAIVVNVSKPDFQEFQSHGQLAGVAFQRNFEKKAAEMGGGNFVVPVQTAKDFLHNKLSGTALPSSSYRLGVKSSPLHQLFPSNITDALKQSLIAFDKEMPGFISDEALLHAVETRTSAPICIPRDKDTYECLSLKGLYPVGEGAGYAGGIVSAAVDGLCAGFSLAKELGLYSGSLLDTALERSQKDTGSGRY